MASNDELTIAELFDFAADIQYKLETNQIHTQLDSFNQAIDRLKLAEDKLDELHIFSDNEEITEISSNELRYFILYALIGWLYEYRPSTVREQRVEDIQKAISYLIKYLQLCQNYGLIKSIPKEHDDENELLHLHRTEDRQVKIQKLKEKKTLEQSIAKLRSMNSDDDEIKRQLYTQQIRWWIQQAEEDITALKDEVKLIKFSKEPIPSVNSPPSQQPRTNVVPVNQTFTLVTTKDRLYKEAIGKGYPSLPTMTVQEFYDDLTKRQSQQPVPPVKPPQQSEEYLNEIDDPTYRTNVRQMDEFKDDNPRGTGNRYNRS